MKRLLIITQHRLYPVDHGAIIRIIEEAKFFRKNGYEVHLAGNRTTKKEKGIIEGMTGAKVHLFPRALIRSRGHFILSKVIKSGGKKGLDHFSFMANPSNQHDIVGIIKMANPDIIQCENIFLSYYVSGIAKRYGIPVLLTEHNVESVGLIKAGKVGAEKEGELKELERDLCNSMDVVTTVSSQDRKRLREIGVKVPIEVTPNGVDYGRYRIDEKAREKVRQKYGFDEEEMVLVFHGTLYYRPNMDANELLIKHIFPELDRRYENLRLLLIGPGHPRVIDGKVMQLPSIPSEELPIYLSMGDVGVVPLMAGSGSRLKIIEYLATGIPTVSTETGAEGLPVTHGENIIITKDEMEDFIEKTARVLENAGLRERLRESGKRLAEEQLDWEVVLGKYLEIFERLEKKA